MDVTDLSPAQRAAIRAGLDLLWAHACECYQEDVVLNAATGNGSHKPLTSEEVEALAARFE